MKQSYLLFCSLFLLLACTGKEPQSDYTMTTFTVDLQKDYPKKEIILQDVADVEYIPLETTDSSLITHNIFHLSEKYIIGINRIGDVILFHRDGTFSHSFNKKGGSGEEYRALSPYLCPDFENEEIYLYDWIGPLKAHIQVYGFDGSYKRTLPLDKYKQVIHLYNYDSNTLIAQDDAWVDSESKHFPYSKTPICMISKQDGQIDSLPITMKERMGAKLYFPLKNSETEVVTAEVNFPLATFSKMGNRFILSNFAQDTVYTYENGNLSPFLIKENKLKGENTMMLNIQCMSERYVYMFIQEKAIIDTEKYIPPTPSFLWYDRKNNSIVNVEFSNADGVSPKATERLRNSTLSAFHQSLPPNHAIQVYPAEFLLALNDEGKLKGKLKEIAANLKEDDNPVLMLVKFKE